MAESESKPIQVLIHDIDGIALGSKRFNDEASATKDKHCDYAVETSKGWNAYSIRESIFGWTCYQKNMPWEVCFYTNGTTRHLELFVQNANSKAESLKKSFCLLSSGSGIARSNMNNPEQKSIAEFKRTHPKFENANIVILDDKPQVWKEEDREYILNIDIFDYGKQDEQGFGKTTRQEIRKKFESFKTCPEFLYGTCVKGDMCEKKHPKLTLEEILKHNMQKKKELEEKLDSAQGKKFRSKRKKLRKKKEEIEANILAKEKEIQEKILAEEKEITADDICWPKGWTI